MRSAVMALAAVLGGASVAFAQSLVNWESPHVHPLDLTPDGSKLLAVNTADNRLEIFAVSASGLSHTGSVTVGLDPVSVRARSDTEAWVVNHISDSISIVDLGAMSVVATLYPGDEPADVVFASNGRAFVTASQLNQVRVFDPTDLTLPPIGVPIEGEDPRALATDGTSVYAAVFESGNRTSSIIFEDVSSPGLNPYPGDPNPPPNDGAAFNPPLNPALPPAPEVSLIVRKDPAGAWRDDNGTDWSSAVTWDLHDHDVAIIDPGTLSVTYATGVMNLNMALAPRPGGGVTVVGTEAINEVRFEPNVRGIFVRVMGAAVTGPGAPNQLADLNPHLDYLAPNVAPEVRELSLGDPRGIAWRAAGDRAYVTGKGSDNLVVVDQGLARVGLVEVGQGPTGVVVDEANGRAYVLNHFEGSISSVHAELLVELERVSFYDPTPAAIRDGRPFLYDTHRTSGLGHIACASCHVDGRMDQIAWDLGDPSGDLKPFNQQCVGQPGCEDWHPMKGPMTTQTLVGIIGTEPLHWRGDREGLPAFNPAFVNLQAADSELATEEMNQFVAFVSTLRPPPNPNRSFTNSLPPVMPNGGNPINGGLVFLSTATCHNCHQPPDGTTGAIMALGGLGLPQSFKIPQLRNLFEKTGFSYTSQNNNRGFGFMHDGAMATIADFFEFTNFNLTAQQKLDIEAFLMCFSTDTHGGVGVQATLPETGAAGQPASVNDLMAVAGSGVVGLVAKGVVSGQHRGWYFQAGAFQSDRASQVFSSFALMDLAGPGSEITFTLVPFASRVRIGVDRDEDGFFDRDELDAGSDPADPASTPETLDLGDLDGDGSVGIGDLLVLLASWGACPDPPDPCPADLDGNGVVGVTDLLLLLGNWG